MAVELFDGNNVMIRAFTDFNVHDRNATNLRYRFHATKPNHIWIWDGKDHNDRRKAVYPPYKSNREPLAENIYAKIRLWRQLLNYSPASQIEVPLWEADDAIATIARKLTARSTEVIIHSNDEDYMQLTANPLVKVNGVRNPKAEGRWIPLYKACVGDSSDSIAGIPGFGKGTWASMEPYWERLEKAIIGGSYQAFEALPLPKRIKTWLAVPGNIELVQTMLTIVHFYTVPDLELNAGTTRGTLNRAAAEEIFGKYLI